MSNGIFSNIFKKFLKFPIVSENGGVTLLASGEETYNFEAFPSDLDQLTEGELLTKYHSLKSSLNNLSEGEWLKFIKIGKRSFVTSPKKDTELGGIELAICTDPVEKFFGGEVPFSDIRFYENYLTANGEYWALVNIDNPFTESRECSLDSYDTDYVLSLRKVGTEVAKKELQLRRRGHGAANNTVFLNHEGEEAFGQIDSMLKDITTGNGSLFRSSAWFIVKATEAEELSRKTKGLIGNLRKDGARAFLETFSIDFFFNHCLIGVPPVKFREFPCNTHYLANLIPFSEDKLHDKGVPLVGYESEVFLDFFHRGNSNNNCLMTGMSGQGKSFFTGALLYHLHVNEGVRLGIFDLGGSFHRLAKYLGGELLSLNFNPLQFNDPQFLFDFFMAVIGSKEFDRQKQGLLMEALKEQFDEDLGFENFYQLINWLELRIEGIRLYFVELMDYFNDRIIDPPSLFYLDIEGMPKSLVAPYLVFAKRLSESREGDTPILNVWDECWDFMSNPIVAEMLTRNVKTGRKQNRANLFISQEITEFTSNFGTVASSIIGNTFTKIYFHQPQVNHPSIPENDKYFLTSVNSSKGDYSEFFFSNPNFRKVLRFYANRFIYELVHTEKVYLEQQKQFIEKKEPILGFRKSFEKWVENVH